MPELPEAETIARGLREKIEGRRIARSRVHRAELVEPRGSRSFERALTGRRIDEVGRRGKWIVVRLDDGNRWVTQLRMTGSFAWSPADDTATEESPHLSLTVRFENGSPSTLRFHDVRRFARMGILTPDEWADLDARLGPEPLDPSFTPANLAGRLEGSRAPLRNALLDQSRIAGLGNVYANEACHRARLDPRRPAGGLASAEVRRLHAAIRALLEAAIERRGTTFSNYQDIGGESGAFQDDLAVYGRSGEPCPRCGGAIARVVLAGRSAFHCTGCQS